MSESKEVVSLSSWKELTEKATFLAKSSMIPTALRGKAHEIAVVLQIGWELDIPPMQAINGIDVINGRPTVSPQLGLAIAQTKLPNLYVKYNELTETKASISMARDRAHKDEAFTSVWDTERTKRMGLAGKDNYVKQPGTMLKWRALGECLRTVCPDVLKGLYTTVEAEDIPPPSAPGTDKANRIQEALGKPAEKEVIAQVVTPVIQKPEEDSPKEDPTLFETFQDDPRMVK